jgi:hypothetical protein
MITTTRGPRPALAAYRRHLDRCKTGDSKRCQICFDLDRQASAEAWRRSQRKGAS